jgi:hypothetical protein
MWKSPLMSIACLNPPGLFFRLDGSLMGGSKSANDKTGVTACHAALAQHERAGATDPEPSPAALDRWLNEKLRMLYGPVLSEPFPEDLAQLIEAHRRRKGDC